ncbi:MAG TPA: alpha-hydroxy acid oxidase [Rhodopila sp.]|nr:alpha-hydroxy acid oxidase [Rhodopila sp.]
MSSETIAQAKPFERAQQAEARLPHRQTRGLKEILDIEEFQARARRILPRAIYGYVANGAEDEVTLATNRAAFRDYRLVPRVLQNVQSRSQAVSLFGQTYAAPFGIAPMGGAAAVTFDADLMMARAAAKSGIPFVLSGNSITPMEEVTQVHPGAWFAAYQSPNTEAIAGMVRRAAAAGFTAFLLTADVPVGSNRENDARTGFSQPIRLNRKIVLDGLQHPRWLAGTAARTLLKRGIPHIDDLEYSGGPSLFSRRVRKIASHTSLSWEHVRLIRRLWTGPFIIKGILSRADARMARECGADGIVVSNHGGRQLDSAATPLQILPDIMTEARGLAVMIDSGFRRGTDVLTALALGAQFVLIGRPFLFACCCAAEAGVLRAIDLLAQEVDRDMALLGLHALDEVGPDMLQSVHGSAATGVAT